MTPQSYSAFTLDLKVTVSKSLVGKKIKQLEHNQSQIQLRKFDELHQTLSTNLLLLI